MYSVIRSDNNYEFSLQDALNLRKNDLERIPYWIALVALIMQCFARTIPPDAIVHHIINLYVYLHFGENYGKNMKRNDTNMKCTS
jgi:hypothetical protein